MSSTTDFSTSTATSPASTSTTDAAYTFSINEATVRRTAIGVGIALGVLLIFALIAIEVMRRKIKRLQKMMSIYEAKRMNAHKMSSAAAYQPLSASTLEAGHHMPVEMGCGREVFESDATPISGPRHAMLGYQGGSLKTPESGMSEESKWYQGIYRSSSMVSNEPKSMIRSS